MAYVPESKTNAVANIAKHFNIPIDIAFNIADQCRPDFDQQLTYSQHKAVCDIATIALSSSEREDDVRRFIVSLNDHIFHHCRGNSDVTRDPEIYIGKYYAQMPEGGLQILDRLGFYYED